jgi:hypothetical protein
MRTLARPATRDHDTSKALAAGRTSAVALAAVLVLVAVWPGGAALAQGAVPCTAIENDAERLACYDRALRPAPPTPAPAARGQQAAPSASAPAATAERRREREVRAAEAPAAPVARAPAPASAPARAAPPEEEIVPIVVVGVRTLGNRPTTFSADDGSTWVQTDSQRLNLPDAPFDAEIKRGAMGSYFLVPADRRAIRVRPMQQR